MRKFLLIGLLSVALLVSCDDGGSSSPAGGGNNRVDSFRTVTLSDGTVLTYLFTDSYSRAVAHTQAAPGQISGNWVRNYSLDPFLAAIAQQMGHRYFVAAGITIPGQPGIFFVFNRMIGSNFYIMV